MSRSPLAGMPAPASALVDTRQLLGDYYRVAPDAAEPGQRVSFGTSGHRGSAREASFNEAHVVAITQALCDYRAAHGITGPVLVGKDTHALSQPAEATVLDVLAANGIVARVQRDDGYTPTPVISHAVLVHNRQRSTGLADGIVISPSHNPPEDGGLKYNPPHGGPADTDVTRWVEQRANGYLSEGNTALGCGRCGGARAERVDFVGPYVEDLGSVVDLDAVRHARLRIGVDPLGGASLAYWQAIRDRWQLDLTVVNDAVDPRFSFMTLDHDGRIRMDCSSADAMAGIIGLRDRFDIAVGNDTDADRHGIVVASAGLMDPSHYQAVAIQYLFAHRPQWRSGLAVGKTLVSSAVIDRVVASVARPLMEVPVGFKWFAQGLLDGTLAFAGEESAGATFLRRDGTVWSTDKDGLIMGLLAAELMAHSGRDPAWHYEQIATRVGRSFSRRIDQPCTAAQKNRCGRLGAAAAAVTALAGERIVSRLERAPGNGAPIGGIKVVSENGWFAARPSGTESIFKIYAESFRGASHLNAILSEAQQIVAAALEGRDLQQVRAA